MFSTAFRYGLISLLELAGADELLQAGAIASRHQLSHHYLSVVLAELRRLGLVQSQKGKNGGYRLLCNPREVSLLSLYRSLAGSVLAELAPVGDGAGPLTDPPSPALRTADAWLQTVSLRWSAELEATSLADLQRWMLEGGSAAGSLGLPAGTPPQ